MSVQVIISHRGNLTGSNPTLENRPDYLELALKNCSAVEVDIWYDNGFFLGHDEPLYEVHRDWILNMGGAAFWHCKNLYAQYRLLQLSRSLKTFCHSNDPYTLVNGGLIWVHDLSLSLNPLSIIPLIDEIDVQYTKLSSSIFGVCTDYVFLGMMKWAPNVCN